MSFLKAAKITMFSEVLKPWFSLRANTQKSLVLFHFRSSTQQCSGTTPSWLCAWNHAVQGTELGPPACKAHSPLNYLSGPLKAILIKLSLRLIFRVTHRIAFKVSSRSIPT